MSKLTVALSILIVSLFVSNTSFAQAVPKKPTSAAKKQVMVCVAGIVQAVESDGVFVFLNDEGKPVHCKTAFKNNHDLEDLHPVGDRITLTNGTIVKKDVLMENWLWVFVKNK